CELRHPDRGGVLVCIEFSVGVAANIRGDDRGAEPEEVVHLGGKDLEKVTKVRQARLGSVHGAKYSTEVRQRVQVATAQVPSAPARFGGRGEAPGCWIRPTSEFWCRGSSFVVRAR